MERYQIHEGIALYYLTFTVVHWLPIFIAKEPCRIITDSLNHCHEHKYLRINAFVIMPTHLHLILFDAEFDNQRLQRTVHDMRKFCGQQLLKNCDVKAPKVFGQLFAGTQRQDRSRQFWQPSRHPVGIWSESVWRSKFNYLHDNPCRKGLVREAHEWRFSSAGYWSGQVSRCDVVLSDVRF